MRNAILAFLVFLFPCLSFADGAWVNVGTEAHPRMYYCQKGDDGKPICSEAEITDTARMPAASPSEPIPAPSQSPQPPIANSENHPPEISKNYAGALLGSAISTTSGSSNNNVLIYSGRVGTSLIADPSGSLSIGLLVAHDSISQMVGTINVSTNSTPILAEILDRNAFGTGLYYGIRLGIGLENASVSQGGASYSASTVAFEFGPVAGYEIPIVSHLNLDLDASWLNSPGTTFDFAGIASVPVGWSSALALQAGLTFHW